MYYIKRLFSGVAEIFVEKPEDYDFEIESIPEGMGRIMVNRKGEIYRDGTNAIEDSASSIPTDHEILMTLLGVTE